MNDNHTQLPHGSDLWISDPLFDGAPRWLSQGSVGLASAETCRNTDGSLRVTVNFSPAFVTAREAAAFLRVSRRTVQRLVERGDLAIEHFGAERRITWGSLLALAGLEHLDVTKPS